VRDGNDDEHLVELKEAAAPATGALVAADAGFAHHGERVVRAARSLLVSPAQRLAAVRDVETGLSFVGRKLAPKEDKLSLAENNEYSYEKKNDAFEVTLPALGDLGRTQGHLLASAHVRAATSLPDAPWSAAERGGLLDRAARLAGAFESAYLAYARLV
jgi:hypothetical protein